MSQARPFDSKRADLVVFENDWYCILSVWVNVLEGIIKGVRVWRPSNIPPSMGINGEKSSCSCIIVPRPEVVVAGFRVPFFP